MYQKAGVDRTALLSSLIRMGKKHLKSKVMKDGWSEDNPTYCYCYVIAEYLWFYKAPKGSIPYSVKVPGDPGLHRFIKWNDGTIVDIAAEQFSNYEEVNYEQAKVRYFLQSGCKGPSKRAKLLAEYMGDDVNEWKNPNDR